MAGPTQIGPATPHDQRHDRYLTSHRATTQGSSRENRKAPRWRSGALAAVLTMTALGRRSGKRRRRPVRRQRGRRARSPRQDVDGRQHDPDGLQPRRSLAFTPDGAHAVRRRRTEQRHRRSTSPRSTSIQHHHAGTGLRPGASRPARSSSRSMPARRTLAFAVIHGGPITESAPNSPARATSWPADRRDARVAVAEAGKSWLGSRRPGHVDA